MDEYADDLLGNRFGKSQPKDYEDNGSDNKANGRDKRREPARLGTAPIAVGVCRIDCDAAAPNTGELLCLITRNLIEKS